MKRSWIKRTKADGSKKKEKEKELEEEYGVKPSYYRYVGRKGIYWYLLSMLIRQRDFNKYGTCISCGKQFNTWKDSQAGHYAPAGNCGFALLFDERNINAECPSCNNPRFSPGKLIPYRANLVKRYGEKFVKKLDADYAAKVMMKEWTQREYDLHIKELQERLKEFEDYDKQTN